MLSCTYVKTKEQSLRSAVKSFSRSDVTIAGKQLSEVVRRSVGCQFHNTGACRDW
jgi:hypothetical protein